MIHLQCLAASSCEVYNRVKPCTAAAALCQAGTTRRCVLLRGLYRRSCRTRDPGQLTPTLQRVPRRRRADTGRVHDPRTRAAGVDRPVHLNRDRRPRGPSPSRPALHAAVAHNTRLTSDLREDDDGCDCFIDERFARAAAALSSRDKPYPSAMRVETSVHLIQDRYACVVVFE